MRKSDAIGIGATVIVLILAIAVFCYAAANNTPAGSPKQDEPVYQYVIKEYNGNIAVYKTGEPQPIDIYEYPVETLPEEDVKNLEAGIQVKDDAQLERLIEDLTS